MQTESTIKKITLERVATVSLLRAIDIEEIAKSAVDGMIPADLLANAGEFIAQVEPNGRGAVPIRHPVKNELEGLAFLAGFEAAVSLKKKSPRKEKTPAEKKAAAAKKKAAAAKK